MQTVVYHSESRSKAFNRHIFTYTGSLQGIHWPGSRLLVSVTLLMLGPHWDSFFDILLLSCAMEVLHHVLQPHHVLQQIIGWVEQLITVVLGLGRYKGWSVRQRPLYSLEWALQHCPGLLISGSNEMSKVWDQFHLQAGHSSFLACVAWACSVEVFWVWRQSPTQGAGTGWVDVDLGKGHCDRISKGMQFSYQVDQNSPVLADVLCTSVTAV